MKYVLFHIPTICYEIQNGPIGLLPHVCVFTFEHVLLIHTLPSWINATSAELYSVVLNLSNVNEIQNMDA